MIPRILLAIAILASSALAQTVDAVAVLEARGIGHKWIRATNEIEPVPHGLYRIYGGTRPSAAVVEIHVPDKVRIADVWVDPYGDSESLLAAVGEARHQWLRDVASRTPHGSLWIMPRTRAWQEAAEANGLLDSVILGTGWICLNYRGSEIVFRIVGDKLPPVIRLRITYGERL